MPLQKLNLIPGINREGTNYSNEGGWYDCDKVRFRSGSPEKIGGWTRLSDVQTIGEIRSLWNWVTFDGHNYLGVGTTKKYYIEYSTEFHDITPIDRTFVTAVTNNCFTTNLTTPTSVLVAIANHGASIGDYVTFSGVVGTVGGITAATLNAEFIVISVPTTGTFTITSPTSATSAATGGGVTIQADFQVPVGLSVFTSGTGWGTGGWGRTGTSGVAPYGWGSAFGSSSGSLGTQLRIWTHDNYGQDLIMAPRGGSIYYWSNATGLSVRAVHMTSLGGASAVPLFAAIIISSAVQQFVIAFGTNSFTTSTYDPMMVRWSDQASPLNWTPAITNQSGEFRLTHGASIVAAVSSRQENLIWTDSAIYSMQYLGPPYVWGFNMLSDNISIISPNAVVSAGNNVTYWMGTDKFYMYSGRVDTLTCTVKQFVFEDLSLSQGYQVFAGNNAGYNEVWWFYCSISSNTIDKYVIYNYLDNVWYTGTMARTAWLDSGIRTYPIAADYNNRLLNHESSTDDVSGTSSVAINAYVQSSDFDIADGHNFGFVWRMLPDVNFNGSDVNSPYVTMTIIPRQNAGAYYGVASNPTVTSGDAYAPPYPPNSSVYIVQHFTGQVYTRLRGRQMSFRIESDSVGVAWQLGATRYDVRPDGRR